MDYFLPFYPPNSPKNENFKKMKKTPRDVIILHKCTKNYDQIVYCSWDAARDISNYLSFWAIFSPFTPLTCPKNENCKKMKEKKHLGISLSYTCEPKIMIRWCMVPKKWCVTDRQTDGQTDAWKKWQIEVDVPPKKTLKLKL